MGDGRSDIEVSRGGAWVRAQLLAVAAFVSGCQSWLSWVESPEAPAPALPANSPVELSRSGMDSLGITTLDPDDAIVRVVAAGVACSGTLIAQDQVLTAHHCVAERADDGAIAGRDVEPDAIRVEIGGDYLPWDEVQVRELVTPSCGHAAGVGDIAILVLSRPLEGAPVLDVRLDEGPVIHEGVHPVGFGRCALSEAGVRRRERPGGQVRSVGPTRFQLEASICPGDSGGPALDAEGRVVGVISASAMDGSEDTRDRTEFTRLDAWRAVFATARAVADGASLAEVPPIDGCPG